MIKIRMPEESKMKKVAGKLKNSARACGRWLSSKVQFKETIPGTSMIAAGRMTPGTVLFEKKFPY